MRTAFWDDPLYLRMQKQQEAKFQHVDKLPAGQQRKYARTRMISAQDWSTCTATSTPCTSTCATDYITITNGGSTSMTVRTYDSGTNSSATGSTWVVTSGTGSGTPTLYSSPQPPPGAKPAQDKQYDPRILNRYLSASDLLEEFIKDLGDVGVTQTEVLHVPLELFINWLVVKAAEADGHTVEDIQKLPDKVERTDRCKCCGKFLTKTMRKAGAMFCNGDHYDKYLEKSFV